MSIFHKYSAASSLHCSPLLSQSVLSPLSKINIAPLFAALSTASNSCLYFAPFWTSSAPTKLIFDSSQTLTSAINQLPAIPIRNNCTPLCCMQPVIYSQKAGYCCHCTANTSYLSLWTIFLPLFHWWKSVFVDSSNVLLSVPSVLYSSDGIGVECLCCCRYRQKRAPISIHCQRQVRGDWRIWLFAIGLGSVFGAHHQQHGQTVPLIGALWLTMRTNSMSFIWL